MKVSSCRKTYFISLFLTLICFQLSCFATENPHNRILEEAPATEYSLAKQWKDDDNSYHYLISHKSGSELYGNSRIIKNLHMIVSFNSENIFRVKIIDNDSNRWEIPETVPFPHFRTTELIPSEQGSCTIEVQADPFSFSVTRKDTGEILFDTRGRNFVFSEYYIQLSTVLPTENVFGFGERNYKFKLSPGTFTIWGRDDPLIIDYGRGGGNTYSHHPVGLVRDKKGNFFLTLMRNSNGMDVIVEDNPALTYKMIGGVIDLIFFVGNEPEPVLKAYHNYLGNFTMMPFWSMGFHQSKWGYVSQQVMEDVVTKYINHDLPLDVIWSDIDYMIDKEIFTIDAYNFPPEKMKEMITKYKKHWVPIIDPGVKVSNTKGPGLSEGLKRDVFLKNHNGGDLVGSVWPGRVHFPDFFNPNTEGYWGEMLEVLYKKVPFSGIWLDMNEVANFVDGEENRYDWSSCEYLKIPYSPGTYELKRKTISLDAVHHGGIVEYNAHELFSLLENAATHKFLESKSKLPFILTRSSSMGVGRYSAHWTGDNGAHWDYLKLSISGNFNFQIFGIPFVGADICGFMDGTNDELCARWTQLGALYPFARNHHEEKTRNQEPWTFHRDNLGVNVLDTTRVALKTRYAVLKWFYSLFIATGGSGSIFRPLMFEFPNEDILYREEFNEWQFLLGKGVLCTPKVEPGEPHVNAYFPIATWYELFSGEEVVNKESTDRVKIIQTPFNASVPLFLRGGHIVHRQDVTHVLSTGDLNDQFELIVALDRDQGSGLLSAQGSIMGIQSFDDDSVYHRCMEDNCLYDINVKIPSEETSSVLVEISFKRQREDIKVPLDTFSLYGLKLYGLPLEFMSEDESKIGYALIQLTGGDDANSTPQLEKLVGIKDKAFSIEFETPIIIEDGSLLKLELII
jgi:alpha-glucosidase (family GH31 glycosyl hydrolase)